MSGTLDERLRGLEHLVLATWLIDFERMRIVWANEAAVKLWQAGDRDELLARDLSGAPATVVARTSAFMVKLREGKQLIEDWTLYPKGIPTPVKLYLSGVPLEDGRIAMLNQALPSEAANNPELLREVEALRHVPVVVALVDRDGKVLMRNPTAMRVFGDELTWMAWFTSSVEASAILKSALEGRIVQQTCSCQTTDGERTHVVHAHATKDPVTGEAGVLVHQTDDTARARAEEQAEEQRRLNRELASALSLVKQQRNDILKLSAPILDVGEGTIAMPIIGTLDEERTRAIAERLLPAVVERNVVNVILDMTSAVNADDAGVGKLIEVIHAIRLVGARPMITGVQPDLATHLANMGFAAADVSVSPSLAAGLSKNRRRSGLVVAPVRKKR